MKLHETIRKYRKQNELTQEQVADALGVTAPAVNKWEHAVSYPDITLLAPLARLLGIDMNTLLGFREELTDREVQRYMNELMQKQRTEGYPAAFSFAEELMRMYPNCDRLRLQAAQLLYFFLAQQKENTDAYKKQILVWLEQVHRGGSQLADAARSALCSMYVQDGDYDRAQQLLDEIPPLGYDKRPMQAVVYHRQGKLEEAYKLYEHIVYQSASQLSAVLQFLSRAYTDDADASARYLELALRVNDLLGLTPLSGLMIQFSAALDAKDAARCIDLLRRIVQTDDTAGEQAALLYPHMEWKQEGLHSVKHMLRQALELDEESAFLRDQPEYQEIVQKLESADS